MTVTLLGATEIRSLAARLDVTPTKKLGQNFVVDANTVRRIVQVAKVAGTDRVVEVGPGLGSLTLAILETGAAVTAVEIDSRLAAELATTAAAHGVPDGALTVVAADAMRVSELPGDPRVLVANLPYNVSVPVLLHLMETFESLERGVVMVQSEVGERLAAAPGSKVYGSPSAKAAWYGSWRTGRQRIAAGVLAGAERGQRAGGVRTQHDHTRHGGRAAPNLPGDRRRLPAAAQDAQTGTVERLGRVRRGERDPAARGSRTDRQRRGAHDRRLPPHRARRGLRGDDFLRLAGDGDPARRRISRVKP